MINIKKQRLEESKEVYLSDIKLYNLFKDKIENDVNFKLPELFNDKYIIFKKLDLEQNLSWESFTYLYNTNNNYGIGATTFDSVNPETLFHLVFLLLFYLQSLLLLLSFY
jgi:hypothetical protein